MVVCPEAVDAGIEEIAPQRAVAVRIEPQLEGEIFDPEVDALPVLRILAVLAVDASLLALPVRRSPEQASRWARESSFASLIGRPPREALETRVRAVLAAAAPPGDASVDAVAKRLGMSRPVLTRQLRAQGTSFRRIKNALRRDLAVSRLAAGEPVADIAEALGFSEASAFQRAFKAWTGIPPGRFRAEAR